ncbi:hypothetical protein EOD39_13189 [Acipenser ruthenus]|uniref:Uncharacterized protein n=1 Tax=Acipenser ruthenus TaxID=7906 RepID=A0A662YQZ7_ACIRT|nr:hypothetical protein EOD39_13189 [Acipenser ruthenus]
MESTGREVCAGGDPTNSNSSSKRHKEMENAALHSSLNSLRVAEEEEDDTATGASVNEYRAEDMEPSGCSAEPDAPPQSTAQDGTEDEDEDEGGQEEELTLTDHLNKRLLSSFLEKLNQRDSSLPGIQRLDCAVAGEEDSNRALDEW